MARKPKSPDAAPDLEALATAVEDAERHRADMVERRSTRSRFATAAELAEHDEALANADRALEIARAQHVAGVEEAAATAAHAEDTRRSALYAAGLAARDAAAALLNERYVPAAQAVADVLREVQEQRRIMAQANEELPAGAERIPMQIEPHNGTPALPIHGIKQVDHRAVIDFVNLPSVDVFAPYIWGAACWGQPR